MWQFSNCILEQVLLSETEVISCFLLSVVPAMSQEEMGPSMTGLTTVFLVTVDTYDDDCLRL